MCRCHPMQPNAPKLSHDLGFYCKVSRRLTSVRTKTEAREQQQMKDKARMSSASLPEDLRLSAHLQNSWDPHHLLFKMQLNLRTAEARLQATIATSLLAIPTSAESPLVLMIMEMTVMRVIAAATVMMMMMMKMKMRRRTDERSGSGTSSCIPVFGG